MKITKAVLKEAEEWVKAINKYLKVKTPIKVLRGTDPNSKRTYARTILSQDKKDIVHIYLYPNEGAPDCNLFYTIFHEMCHIALWPLTQGNPVDGKLDKIEERIVTGLENLMRKINERK